MLTQYKLTQQLHEIIPEVAKKYGKEIEINSDFYFYEEGFQHNGIECSSLRFHKRDDFYEYVIDEPIDTIEASQIKQVLLALQDVLGENPEWETWFYRKNEKLTCKFVDYTTQRSVMMEVIHKSNSDALCQKWLDGLNPLFNTNPIKVLTEFLEILENLNNK